MGFFFSWGRGGGWYAFAIHITSRRKEGGLATAENWMDVGAGKSNGGGGLGFGLGLEVGSAYNIGQTRTQPKSGMEIGGL